MYNLKNEEILLALLNHQEMITEHQEITLDLILKSLSKTLTNLLKDKGVLISHINAGYEYLGQNDAHVLSVTPIPLNVDEQSLEDIEWIMIAINSKKVSIYLSDEIYKFINNKTLMYQLFELEKQFLLNVYNKNAKNFSSFNIDYVEDDNESVRIYELTYYLNTDHKEIALISYDKTEDDEVIVRPIYEEDLYIKTDVKILDQMVKEMITNKNTNTLTDLIKEAISHEITLDDEDQIQINIETNLENVDHDTLEDDFLIEIDLENVDHDALEIEVLNALENTSDPLANIFIKLLKDEDTLTDEEIDEVFKQLYK